MHLLVPFQYPPHAHGIPVDWHVMVVSSGVAAPCLSSPLVLMELLSTGKSWWYLSELTPLCLNPPPRICGTPVVCRASLLWCDIASQNRLVELLRTVLLDRVVEWHKAEVIAAGKEKGRGGTTRQAARGSSGETAGSGANAVRVSSVWSLLAKTGLGDGHKCLKKARSAMEHVFCAFFALLVLDRAFVPLAYNRRANAVHRPFGACFVCFLCSLRVGQSIRPWHVAVRMLCTYTTRFPLVVAAGDGRYSPSQ